MAEAETATTLPQAMGRSSAEVTVLGGGIAGITSAVACALKGYAVQLYTATRADRIRPEHASPWFATPIGAGNIEPIGVSDPDLFRLFSRSQAFYRVLCERTAHVEERRFYRLGEDGNRREAPYDELLNNHSETLLQKIEASVPRTECVPKDADVITFNVYGAENSLLDALYTAAERLGVQISEEEVPLRERGLRFPGAIINCTGLDGPKLRGTPVAAEMRPVQGHLLYVDDVPIDQIPEIEYAVRVKDEVESSVREAYAFIRNVENDSARLVLGGSEIEGSYDQNGEACAFPPVSRPRQIGENEIPAQIVDTHAEIWWRLASLDLKEFPHTIVSGVRPRRKEGPKIDVTELEGKILVDNYGWGGVGWTLAPGAAVKVASLLQDCKAMAPTNRIDHSAIGDSPCVKAMSAAFENANHEE